ncbi:MAG: radical SAM protein, partial [Candidatus Omnitrophica bacterium]|nr:radical SAM protein [Candidatus Omnitrophota bacterium]
NSNLMLATDEVIKILKGAGLDHVLTSLNSYSPGVNDYIVNHKGAHEKVVRGIEFAVKNGLRVSVNMIVSQWNKTHVYETGRLAHRLGCQKIFGTRVVPPSRKVNSNGSNFDMSEKDYISILDQLLEVKHDTGIMIGTLVSYPLCMLGDLEKYSDFVGRGCPAQSGHLMSINANGQTHACVHQAEGYGNIFEIGIYKAYENMRKWHNQSYRYSGCEKCCYIDICKTGCRMSSHARYGVYDKKDDLRKEKGHFLKPYKIVYDPIIYEKMRLGARFLVPGRLRFRQENSFYLVNIRWANSIIVPSKTAEFLMQYKQSGKDFTLLDFGKDNEEFLAKLFFRDAVESKDINYSDFRHMAGLGVDSLLLK